MRPGSRCFTPHNVDLPRISDSADNAYNARQAVPLAGKRAIAAVLIVWLSNAVSLMHAPLLRPSWECGTRINNPWFCMWPYENM
jgi:hypothetical protein